ncbi:MAG: PHB depolymerase family esterase [Pseudomonadota bacterium]
MIRHICFAFSILIGAVNSANAGCGPSPDACEIDNGTYHISLPENPQAAPVVMFLHGAGGSGATTIGNKNLVQSINARGYAVIAPSGSRRFGNGQGLMWAFRSDWPGRNERDFLLDVVADAATRFGVSGDQVLLGGFSGGAFMVYYLACEAPGTFAAYAPVSGGFWKPHPQSCAGPVMMFHTHGWTDRTVPLEGRPLRGGDFIQGDIFAGLEIWRAANGCSYDDPTGTSRTGEFLRRRWTDCAEASALEFALFPGGHTVPDGWADMVLDWFEGLPGT